MVYSIGRTVGIKPLWKKSANEIVNEFSLPMPGVGAMGNFGKLAVVSVAGIVTGMTFFGSKQLLEQSAKQQVEAKTGGFTFYAQPGSTVTVLQPQTGSVTQDTKQTQTAEQKPGDWTNLIILGVVGAGALILLSKWRGGKK